MIRLRNQFASLSFVGVGKAPILRKCKTAHDYFTGMTVEFTSDQNSTILLGMPNGLVVHNEMDTNDQ